MRIRPIAILCILAAPLRAEPPSARVLCDEHADALFAALDEGRYEAAMADFEDGLRARYPAAKLRQDYESLPAKYGKLLGRGRPHDGDINGHGIVMAPLIFERGTVTAEVRCNGEGAISDVRLLPTQAMSAP
ncbi:MAG TPA: hypothetical protein VHE32_08645 [Rhodanobacteraceae bacterium]|jgi:hypothetical protein|nr:hypothetical protein [Rhodanobacteraceae bacterium]